eukprot:COSAG01_NODE_7442_length_3210_cov_15.798457_2_plen_169_part_00
MDGGGIAPCSSGATELCLAPIIRCSPSVRETQPPAPSQLKPLKAIHLPLFNDILSAAPDPPSRADGCPDPAEGTGRCESFAGEQGVAPGWDGVGVYSTDFGQLSMLTCFDINFPELWHEAYALGAQLVVWPSAMNSYTDPSAPSYARLHQYYVAAVGQPGNMYAPTGR